MPLPTYRIRCLGKAHIAPKVYELRFTKPEGFAFKPGQFLLFQIPKVDKSEDLQVRSLSIASSPKEEHLLFCMKMKEGGRISRWMEELLEVGMEVTMQGPLGVFTLDRKTDKPYVFLATGTGVSPIRSHLKWALEEQGDPRPMHLVFCVREEQDLFWVDQFEALATRFPNFTFSISLTRGSDAWRGCRGRVYEVTPTIIRDITAKSLYICGAPAVVKDCKRVCMETWGLGKSDVHAEEFI